MRIRKIIFYFILVIIFGILIINPGFFLNRVASFLIVRTELTPVDVIVVLGGGERDRVLQAISLYQKGLSQRFIFTGGVPFKLPGLHTTWSKLAELEALSWGISPEKIYLEERSTSTFEDALYTLEDMQRLGFHSAIIVSDPTHMRRVQLIFKSLFYKKNIHLEFSPVENSWFKIDKWWSRERELIAVVNEYQKLLFYLFKYLIPIWIGNL